MSAALVRSAHGTQAPSIARSLIRRHPLIVFFGLAFGLTWVVEIPMYVPTGRITPA